MKVGQQNRIKPIKKNTGLFNSSKFKAFEALYVLFKINLLYAFLPVDSHWGHECFHLVLEQKYKRLIIFYQK